MSLTLEIITPYGRVVKSVDSLRAEDASGSFGILARHLDLLTVLRPMHSDIYPGGQGGLPCG